jgi:hypothetical protein
MAEGPPTGCISRAWILSLESNEGANNAVFSRLCVQLICSHSPSRCG